MGFSDVFDIFASDLDFLVFFFPCREGKQWLFLPALYLVMQTRAYSTHLVQTLDIQALAAVTDSSHHGEEPLLVGRVRNYATVFHSQRWK